jgi:predicted PurR-regulated permease PerM
MTREMRAIAWLVGISVFAFLLSLLSSVLMPFVAGMAVAYFLDPLADRLEKWGCSRVVATSLITALFFLLAAGVAVLLFPLLQAQVVAFISRVPHYAEVLREQAAPVLEHLQSNLPPDAVERLRGAAGSYAGEAIQWVGTLLKNLWSGGVALLNVLSLVVITPLVTFYLLRDWDRIMERLDTLLPRRAAPTIRAQVHVINRTLAGFMRGQATVCLLLGIFYAVGLTLVGLDFGLLVGLGTGLISFIPYFGMLVGLVTGLGIAFVQFADIGSVALVAAVFAAGQVIEGYALTPRLVGDRVGLHPVWILFALLAGGALFGFTGVMLAIPVAAVIGVLVRFSLDRYMKGPLYGEPEEREGDGSS